MSQQKLYNYLKYSVLIIITIITLFNPITSQNVFSADIEIVLNKLEVKQGGIIKATLKSNTVNFSQNNYIAEIAKHSFPFYPDKNSNYSATIGVSYWTNTGENTIKIKQNNKYIYHKNIEVKSGKFPKSWIEVSDNKEKLVRPEEQDENLQQKLKEDSQKVARARSKTSQKKLWNNHFIWPLEGIITTEFGATRFVNSKLQSKHSGIDIAADTGTPVKTAATGIVTLAADLTITGKTIIIDHGHGVFSSYCHLNKMLSQKGDKVKKGDKIGEIGSTGFSTGPHLHWTIKVDNVYINPENFIN